MKLHPSSLIIDLMCAGSAAEIPHVAFFSNSVQQGTIHTTALARSSTKRSCITENAYVDYDETLSRSALLFISSAT